MRQMERIKKITTYLERNCWEKGINPITGYRISPKRNHKKI